MAARMKQCAGSSRGDRSRYFKIRISGFTKSNKVSAFPHLRCFLEPDHHCLKLDRKCGQVHCKWKSLHVIWYPSANYCEDGVWSRGPCQQGSRSLCPYTSDLELSLFMGRGRPGGCSRPRMPKIAEP